MTRVKICCISSTEEARLAVRLGASALGLVSEMPSGAGVISEALITEIAVTVPPPVATFLLTSRTDSAKIIAQQRRCGVNTVQICDRLAPRVHAELRKALPGISLVQVVHISVASYCPGGRRPSPRFWESVSSGQGTRWHRPHARLVSQRANS